jgi:hypothetical protein
MANMKFFLLCLLLIPNLLHAAGPLSEPKGDVILEIYGDLALTNVDGEAHFDRAMIEELDTSTIVTSNHVLSKPATYKGPVLGDLLNKLGAKGDSILVTALDDYTAELKRSVIEKYGVLLATHENDRMMTIDDRGPFFIVFPFDQYKELRKDLYYNMSVWQIKSIEIE